MSRKQEPRDWHSIAFCPDLQDGSFNYSRMAALLGQELFAGDTDIIELFTARYRQMAANYVDVPHDDPRWDLDVGRAKFVRMGRDKEALLSVPRHALPDSSPVARLWNYTNLRHDMPIWMVKQGVENPLRAMIVFHGVSRTEHPAKSLVLSTPFGFHSGDFRDVSCGNDALCHFVWRCLVGDGDKACVYLTSGMKFRADDGQNECIGDFEECAPTFDAVLQAEIAAFMPDMILACGRRMAVSCGILPQLFKTLPLRILGLQSQGSFWSPQGRCFVWIRQGLSRHDSINRS